MSKFDPQPEEEFTIHIDGNQRRFCAMEHPNAPGMVHAMQGGKALVFHILDLESSQQYAIKVMMPRHRDPSLEAVCRYLDQFKNQPGLAVCERFCLTPARAGETHQQYSNLEYAILMPWVEGFSWFDAIQLGKNGQCSLGEPQSLRLASNLATVLANLEQAGIAHCDLSAGNVLLNVQTQKVQLIDVEDLFAAGLQPPMALPLGTPGYQHRTSHQGQWHAASDRFAAAILLSEMLGWHDPAVRSASYDESYFAPEELQSDASQRLDVLVDALRRFDGDCAELLLTAWQSVKLEQCPSMREWAMTIAQIGRVKWGPPPDLASAAISVHAKPIWAPLDLPPPPSGPAVHWDKEGIQWPVAGAKGSAVVWNQPEASLEKPSARQEVQWQDGAETGND